MIYYQLIGPSVQPPYKTPLGTTERSIPGDIVEVRVPFTI